jgi:hypothetical protein
VVGFVLVAGIALGVGISVGKHSTGARHHAGAKHPSAPAAAPATTAAALPSGGQQYATDMQSSFNFGSSVTVSDLANFGQQVCAANTSVAGEVPIAQAQWSNTTAGDAIQMIILARRDMCPSQLRPQTVSYVVTGSPGASVTYGPSGSDFTGSVPMSVAAKLGSPSYYAINAQLQGSGQVTCKLKVDGVTISSATASGGFNIAGCEISQDATTSSWVNDNSG